MDWRRVQQDTGFPEKLIPLFEEHEKYGTSEAYMVDGKPVACARCNIVGYIANILDLFCVDKKYSIKAMRWFGVKLRERFPYVKYIRFERRPKYPLREVKVYKLERLMR
jgi:hypothetical protein